MDTIETYATVGLDLMEATLLFFVDDPSLQQVLGLTPQAIARTGKRVQSFDQGKKTVLSTSMQAIGNQRSANSIKMRLTRTFDRMEQMIGDSPGSFYVWGEDYELSCLMFLPE